VLTRDGSGLLEDSWERARPASLDNCVGMCCKDSGEEKASESNSTSSSFVREH
jgi:hypothetical protein